MLLQRVHNRWSWEQRTGSIGGNPEISQDKPSAERSFRCASANRFMSRAPSVIGRLMRLSSWPAPKVVADGDDVESRLGGTTDNGYHVGFGSSGKLLSWLRRQEPILKNETVKHGVNERLEPLQRTRVTH
jgi:hypothetical protein